MGWRGIDQLLVRAYVYVGSGEGWRRAASASVGQNQDAERVFHLTDAELGLTAMHLPASGCQSPYDSEASWRFANWQNANQRRHATRWAVGITLRDDEQ